MDVAGFRPRCATPISFGLMIIAALTGCTLLGPTTATSFLNQIEHSQDPNERFKAYEKLASDRCYDTKEQRTRAVQVLIAGLEGTKEPKEPVATRAVICRTLGILGDPAGRESMIRLVRDPDVLVRTEACRSLGKLGKPEDATILMQIMTLDSDADCQIAAIEALGALKSVDPRTPSYLVQAMDENENPAIRLAAVQTLRKLTGKNLGVKAEAWREYLATKDDPKGIPKPAKSVVKTPTLDKAARPASTSP